ncbi:XRE family transcriptional regulator [Paraclostridium bifermentans]|uniref:XRE family transcriptional regulator n=1 Tax=Paraclostridium bifermentans TaxID=1490 RepID=A0A5P3XF36_PARBF|nr:helix-turn-helix transcriptional regulator [Paraclostridium bifermentans]QEZ68948.1 XRE family transcriptional regulator [Paraclostridium bifermentans]
MGVNLKIARIKKGLSQEDVCELARVGRVTLSKLENGEGNPRRDLMIRLSKVLETPVEELFFYEK